MTTSPQTQQTAGTPTLSVTIEEGGPGDTPLVWPFVEALHRHEKLPPPGPLTKQALETVLRRPDLGRCLIARDGTDPSRPVLGYCVLGFGFSIEFDGRHAFVDQMLVREEARGRGVSSQLLDAAERICRSEGMSALHLEAPRGNETVHAAYRERGFADHPRDFMTKRLAQ